MSRLKKIRDKFRNIVAKIFRRKKTVKLGFYGPTNSGKTTLANKICMDWLGEEMGKASAIPHETREIQMKEHLEMEHNGKKLVFNMIDTPGIATKIDFEDFVRKGMKKADAKQRAKEATKGVIESIKWLDNMDVVLVVMDSAVNPVDQVNVTILGNLEARGIPLLIVANKIDKTKANAHVIRTAFPQYTTVGISAKTGHNIKGLYESLFDII
jgi:GTP-binding protein Era